MIKRTRRITIDKFMDLWDKIYDKKFDEIVPTLSNKILKHWKWEISERFYNVKLYGSEADIPFNQLPYYIRVVSDMKEVPSFYLPRRGYNRDYMRQYPITFVKIGDLKSIMLSNSSYGLQTPGTSGELKITVNIPFYRRDPSLPDTYRKLEEQRSYIKSSFIMAWPKILHEIMEALSR